MSAVETIGVEYTLRGVERISGAGRLLALAIVELDIAGVVLTLQGVRIMRRPDGGLTVEAPTFRHPRTGKSLPCILLPDALSAAIAAEVLAAIAAPTMALQARPERVARHYQEGAAVPPRLPTLATLAHSKQIAQG